MIKKIVVGFVLIVALAVALLVVWPEKSYAPYEVDAAYQAQVDAFDFPDMPPDWQWHRFTAKDGTSLRWGETGNRDAAKASLIWVPGYTASFDMYGEHVEMLARRGYHVIGFDLRGQGGSERARASHPEKMWVSDFSVYSNDLADFIQSLPPRDGRPLILSAISFGGHVATRAMGDHALPVDGLFLLAPAFRPKSAPYTFEEAKRLTYFARALGKSRHYAYGQTDWRPEGLDFSKGSDCSSNPKRLFLRDVLFTRHPEQRVGGATNQWGAEFFESSEYILEPGYLEKISVPITVISAENDTFVETSYNSRACSEAFPDCREVTPAGTGHCLPQESDEVVNQIFDEIDALLARTKDK